MPLNVAFHGTGSLARPYLNALSRRSDARVAAVCDADARAAETAAAALAARAFPALEPMLAEAAPDALWICVPPNLQGEAVERAVLLNIPFFVEPPGAADFVQAEQLARRIEEARLVSAVGYSARFVDVIREAKEYLGVNVVALALGWWLTGPGEASGAAGLLWNEACRLVDLLRFLCGEARPIGTGSAIASGTDALTLTFRLERGTTATLAVGAYEMAEPRIELELLGEGWYFRFQEALSVLRLAERDKITIIRQSNAPHAEHAVAFLDAVRSRKPAAGICPFPDALKTLRICHDAIQASQSRTITAESPNGSQRAV